MNIIATVALSSLKSMLSKVKRGYPAWFSLFHPHSLLEIKEVLTALGAGDSTKVLATEPSHWELICNKFLNCQALPLREP